jgi:hypothetical protein
VAGAVLAGALAVIGARRANTLDAEHEAA